MIRGVTPGISVNVQDGVGNGVCTTDVESRREEQVGVTWALVH